MLGGTTSTVRTADQTALARFWSDLPGTFDPPGHWNQITEIAAITSKTNLENSARAFALVDIALADAGIKAWNVKYTVQHGAAGDGDPRRGRRRQPPDHGRTRPGRPCGTHPRSRRTSLDIAPSAPPPRPPSPRSTGINFSFTDPGNPTENLTRAISPASRRPPRKRGSAGFTAGSISCRITSTASRSAARSVSTSCSTSCSRSNRTSREIRSHDDTANPGSRRTKLYWWISRTWRPDEIKASIDKVFGNDRVSEVLTPSYETLLEHSHRAARRHA